MTWKVVDAEPRSQGTVDITNPQAFHVVDACGDTLVTVRFSATSGGGRESRALAESIRDLLMHRGAAAETSSAEAVIRRARMVSDVALQTLLYFPPSNSDAGRRAETRPGFTQTCNRLENLGLIECLVRVYPCTFRRTSDGDRVVALRTDDGQAGR